MQAHLGETDAVVTRPLHISGTVLQRHSMAASRKSRPLERKDLVRTSAWVEGWVHGSIARRHHAEGCRFQQLYKDAEEAVKEVRLRLLKFV